ncbi:MAG: 4Fe-4S binding protein [Chloroflexi bacterium]|jgi:MinD superfamily P-loop ATPase|nr:4Fe-4S binding protein [Chloroflexota bacterium]MBT7080499.1 4Fe-4S binding protein [Chloroflexota bacterium]MBT7288938.1 4Fe-4S binding protein [Chloroflexota bacterium]
MKELVILSGKGGTGKTTIAASFAALAKDKVLSDCDVDAADLHLLLKPDSKITNEFWAGQTAVIDADKCTECGLCQDLCRFDAIHDYKVDPVACEGCCFCKNVCGEDAITMQENMSGHWYVSGTKYGPMVHAKLGIAQENSGRLVTVVRQNAKEKAEDSGLELIISDGPPGIGCPVISSLSGATAALIVTEPSLSGMHDLDRIIGVCSHFGIPAMVCINKYDINEENTATIEKYCADKNIEVIAKIPFDNAAIQALIEQKTLVEHSNGALAKQVTALWNNLSERLMQS